MKYLYFILLTSIMSAGCDYYNYDLSFRNKSASTLSLSYSNGNLELNENNIAYYISDWVVVKPDSVWYMVKPGREDAWLEYINEGKEKKLTIYVWNLDTLTKYNGLYGISDLQNAHKYIKSFTLTEKQLKRHKWLTEFN